MKRRPPVSRPARAATRPGEVRLRRRLDEVIRAGHPWIYRDALEAFEEKPGAVVTVLNQRGKFLARGLAERGPIGVRVFLTEDAPLDDALLRERVTSAFKRRSDIAKTDTTAYRLVHGEGDRLPGFVCDRYGEAAVLQIDGAAAEAWRDRFVAVLRPAVEKLGVTALLARTGVKDARRVDVIFGQPTDALTVREHGMLLPVDLLKGQKTGLFLDHRESRRRVRELAKGRDVLNLYGYNGAFSVAAGLGNARRVTTVDIARGAIEGAKRSWAMNGLREGDHRAVASDVKKFLESSRERYGLIIADPPSFAPNEKSVPKALAAYRALHRSCLEHLAPDGIYLAASCSSHVREIDFERTITDAARGLARIDILDRWGAGKDHPVVPAFPEGHYLKVLLVRAV